MNEKNPYQKQWEEYRRLRNRQYIVFIVGGVIINLLVYLSGSLELNSNVVSTIQIVLLIIWLVSLIYVIFRFHTWKCPNCGKRFFVASFWVRQPEFLSNCRHCDLRKYTGSTFEKN
jgi:membrane protein YdbS with pleckstrin-like domain